MSESERCGRWLAYKTRYKSKTRKKIKTNVQNSGKEKRQICTIHDKFRISHTVFHTSFRPSNKAEIYTYDAKTTQIII